MIMKNKRGSIEIVLLVMLVLLVTSATIFSFITSSGKVETKISDVRFIERFYLKENLIEFYIQQAGEDAIVVTYGKEIEDEELVNTPKEKFISNFKTEFMKYEFDEKYLKDLKEIIEKENFDVLVGKEFLVIDVNNLEIQDSFNDISVIYHPKIFLEFDLKN